MKPSGNPAYVQIEAISAELFSNLSSSYHQAAIFPQILHLGNVARHVYL
jgi:hypothetical protein